jgi:hypothetical protein
LGIMAQWLALTEEVEKRNVRTGLMTRLAGYGKRRGGRVRWDDSSEGEKWRGAR